MIVGGGTISYYLAKRLLDTHISDKTIELDEARWYTLIIGASTLLIFANTLRLFDTAEQAFRHAFFQVSSIITTTGFSTTDFNLYPSFSKAILILLMFIGACAGRTGGGIKVSRIVILVKSVFNELSRIIHPRAVKKCGWRARSSTTPPSAPSIPS